VKFKGKRFDNLSRNVRITLYANLLKSPEALVAGGQELDSLKQVLEDVLKKARNSKCMPALREWAGEVDEEMLIALLVAGVRKGLNSVNPSVKGAANKFYDFLKKYERAAETSLQARRRSMQRLLSDLAKRFDAELLQMLPGFEWLSDINNAIRAAADLGGEGRNRKFKRAVKAIINVLCAAVFVFTGCAAVADAVKDFNGGGGKALVTILVEIALPAVGAWAGKEEE
jgi:hypothetical protein